GFPRGTKCLLVDVGLPCDAHADALVEMRGAGLVAGVDRQGDPALSAPVELAERLEEERTADAPSAPRLEGRDGVHPARAEPECVDRRSDDPVALAHQIDEAGIPELAIEAVLAPLLERLRLEPPVLGERVLGDP